VPSWWASVADWVTLILVVGGIYVGVKMSRKRADGIRADTRAEVMAEMSLAAQLTQNVTVVGDDRRSVSMGPGTSPDNRASDDLAAYYDFQRFVHARRTLPEHGGHGELPGSDDGAGVVAGPALDGVDHVRGASLTVPNDVALGGAWDHGPRHS
jgi:hypothetical protein